MSRTLSALFKKKIKINMLILWKEVQTTWEAFIQFFTMSLFDFNSCLYNLSCSLGGPVFCCCNPSRWNNTAELLPWGNWEETSKTTWGEKKKKTVIMAKMCNLVCTAWFSWIVKCFSNSKRHDEEIPPLIIYSIMYNIFFTTSYHFLLPVVGSAGQQIQRQ